MTTVSKYDAFTSMNFYKKMALVKFLCTVNNTPDADKEKVTKAVDYALKETVSFGGFIIALEKDSQFVGAIVVNKSGMGGLLPENLVVLNGVAENVAQEEVLALLLKEAATLTGGDVALVRKVDHSNEVHILSLEESNVKYLNDSTLRERVFLSIAS